MAIFSRISLFSLALGGLAASSTAWSQESSAVPEATDPPPPAASTAEPAADRPGIIHVSDAPPADSGVFGTEASAAGESGMKCPEYIPPHAGWDQPGRRPMYRSWVPYHKFFPDSWTGTAVPAQHRAPMVYLPTDTTQLGYYYQHVPTWHAYSGMLPPVPRPSDWHYIYREPVYGYTRPATGAQPRLAPTPDESPAESPAPTPTVPSETSLDRSAARPDLVPIPQ